MSNTAFTRRAVPAVAAAATLTMLLASCSSGTTTTASDTAGADGEFDCSAPALEGVDLEGAREITSLYTEAPGTLEEVLQISALGEAPSQDLKVSFIDMGTVVSGIMYDSIAPAGEALGIDIERVQAGSDAQSINTAMSSVIESQPDIVLALSVDPAYYVDHIDAMEEAGITLATAAIANGPQYGLPDSFGGEITSRTTGDLLAASAIDITCGQSKDFVFYNVPELSASSMQLEAAAETLAELCDDCTLREVQVPIAQLATTGPDTVISDLQAHPETGAFITIADELQMGLQAKQDLAGLNVPGIGQSSTPANIQQIADGTQTAGLATDLGLSLWLVLDQGLRRHAGEDVGSQDYALANQLITRIVTEENASELAETGFIAVPDYQERLKALWLVD